VIVQGLRSRTSRAVLPIALAAALFGTSPVSAAEVSTFDISVPIDEVAPADCFDGTMHVVGTERIAGRRVDLGDDDFRMHGTISDAFDVAFSNGWTGTWTTAERFSFSVRGSNRSVTNVHRDTTAVYDSSGRFIGTVTFRVVEHLTVAGGVVRVEFAHPTLTCDLP
jgi:hypothetical protein